MTKTQVGKATKRETRGLGVNGRPVIVSLEFPNIVGLRLKGTRTTYLTTAEACYWMAAKAAVAAAKAEKRKARRNRP